eukprot:7387439-Prymnesium_polylepis.2
MLVREQGLAELAAKKVQNSRRTQVTRRRQKAAVRVQKHTRGAAARNKAQDMMKDRPVEPPTRALNRPRHQALQGAGAADSRMSVAQHKSPTRQSYCPS